MADVNIIIQAKAQQAISEMKRAENGAKSLGRSISRTTGVSNQYGKVVDKNTRGLSTFAKSGLQQTGYQVGDFAVQVGGGTSMLQAFGQQGSQLFGIFGAGGAILGAAIAIVAALGNAYLKSTDMVKDFSEEIDELTTATKTYTDLVKGERTTLEDLGRDYFNVTEEVKALHASKIALAEFNLKEQLNQTINALRGEFDAFGQVARVQEKVNNVTDKSSKQYKLLQRQLRLAKTNAFELGESLGLQREQTEALMGKFEALSTIDAFGEPLRAATILTEIADMLIPLMDGADLATLKTVGSIQLMAEQFLKVKANADIVKTEVPNAFGLIKKDTDRLSQGIANSFGQSFKSVIQGTESIKDAFKNMAASIISQLIDVLIIQQLVGTVGTGGKGTGTGLAGFFSRTGKAIGGSVQSGSTYMVGERGPEMFIPNSSGTIVPNNKMGGGAGVVVNQTINVSTGVAQTVRTEIATLMPQIAEASKAAVLDAKQRGGNFSRAF
jgi:hypothetical protein